MVTSEISQLRFRLEIGRRRHHRYLAHFCHFETKRGWMLYFDEDRSVVEKSLSLHLPVSYMHQMVTSEISQLRFRLKIGCRRHHRYLAHFCHFETKRGCMLSFDEDGSVVEKSLSLHLLVSYMHQMVTSEISQLRFRLETGCNLRHRYVSKWQKKGEEKLDAICIIAMFWNDKTKSGGFRNTKKDSVKLVPVPPLN